MVTAVNQDDGVKTASHTAWLKAPCLYMEALSDHNLGLTRTAWDESIEVNSVTRLPDGEMAADAKRP